MKKIILMILIITMLTINVAFGIAIVDVACGLNHTVLLAEDGTVWTMGDNSEWQCGHSFDKKAVYIPKQILNIPKMVKVVAAANKTMLLGEDGCVYEISGGKLVATGINNIVDIAIGCYDKDEDNVCSSHIQYAALTGDGDVYTKGDNGYDYYYDEEKGYLGRETGASNGFTSSWGKVELSNIEKIFFNAGLRCIDKDGVLYKAYKSYGCDGIETLGNVSGIQIEEAIAGITAGVYYTGEDGKSYYSSFRIGEDNDWYENDPPTAIKTISCADGGEIKAEEILSIYSNIKDGTRSANSIIILTKEGIVYDDFTPLRNYNVYSKKIIKASIGGSGHKILIDEDGNAYGYGDNTYGQLGLGGEDSEEDRIEIVAVGELNASKAGSSGDSGGDGGNLIEAIIRKGDIIRFLREYRSYLDYDEKIDLNDYFGSSIKEKVSVIVPTLIESLQEIVPNEQSSLAYMTSDARVWIGGIANFSLMFEVNEDMTLRNTGNNLQDIFTNGALNLKVYEVYNNGAQVLIPTAQGQVYNIYEDGVNITQSITPNFVFKSGKVYQLECGIGGDGVFMDRYGETRNYYTVKFEGMNASKVKDGVVTQMRSSVDIAKFILKVYVTELANLT